MASGYISPDTSELVIVYVNWSTSQKSVTHRLSNLSNGNTVASLTPYITNAYNNLSKQETIAGHAVFTIPARSVVTLVASLDDENLIYTKADEHDYHESYRISPNPTEGMFTISNIKTLPDNNPDLLIFNTTGRLIYADIIDGSHYSCNALNGKQDGLYFIKVGNHCEKIIKTK